MEDMSQDFGYLLSRCAACPAAQLIVERLEQVLVVLDHPAAHVDAKPLLVHVQLIAIEHLRSPAGRAVR